MGWGLRSAMEKYGYIGEGCSRDMVFCPRRAGGLGGILFYSICCALLSGRKQALWGYVTSQRITPCQEMQAVNSFLQLRVSQSEKNTNTNTNAVYEGSPVPSTQCPPSLSTASRHSLPPSLFTTPHHSSPMPPPPMPPMPALTSAAASQTPPNPPSSQPPARTASARPSPRQTPPSPETPPVPPAACLA